MKAKRKDDRLGNPWLNLESYEEHHAHLFCGRDAAVERLTQRVLDNRVTVLIGPSGCGKSSLLRAGLFPALRRAGCLPVALKFDFAEASPLGLARQTIAQIERNVAERPDAYMGVETPSPTVFAEDGRQSLWEYLQRLQVWTRGAELARPVLVFDQFEEFFSLGAANPNVAAWLQGLSDAFENNRPEEVRRHLENTRTSLPFPFQNDNARFVIAIRADRLALLTEHCAVLPSLVESRNHELLRPFNGAEALEAVLGPPARAGCPELLDAATARAVVRRVAARHEVSPRGADSPLESLSVEPAVLSVECHELFRTVGVGGRITLELLEQSHEDILSAFYERAVAKLPDRVARFVEMRLVEGDVRTPVPLRVALKHYRLRETDLVVLKKACLVREEQRGGDTFVELTHDVLIGPVRDRARQRRFRAAGRGVAIALILAGCAGGSLFVLFNQRSRLVIAQRRGIVLERRIDELTTTNRVLVMRVAELANTVAALRNQIAERLGAAERKHANDIRGLEDQNRQLQRDKHALENEISEYRRRSEQSVGRSGIDVKNSGTRIGSKTDADTPSSVLSDEEMNRYLEQLLPETRDRLVGMSTSNIKKALNAILKDSSTRSGIKGKDLAYLESLWRNSEEPEDVQPNKRGESEK